MNTTLYVKRFDPTAAAEVTEDVSLPDYLPEVRRVVGVQAAVTVDGKYLSGEELEADGGVTYTVLYTTADGSLAQISETTSYTGHIPLKTDEDRYGIEDIVLSAALDNVSCRVTAPRKITLSSKVKLCAVSEKPADASLHISDAAGDVTVRRRTSGTHTGYMTELRQNGEAEGEIREREGMKLISASGNICIGDVRMSPKSDGKSVMIKGDVTVTMLMLSPEGSYVQSRSRMPVEEEIPLREKASADETVVPAAFARVVMIEVDGGEDGIFSWKTEYDIDCILLHCAEAEITADAYLTERDDSLSTGEFKICSPAAAVNGRLTTSAAVGLRPECTFVCAWGTASADKAEISGNRMNLAGSVKLCAVTAGGGEFFVDEVTVPMKYTGEAIAGAESGESLIGKIAVDVCDVTARADGNMLNFTAELLISAALLSEKAKTAAVMLSAADAPDTKYASRKNRIRVYVPDEGETAWDVEKKFRLGRDAVKEGEVYVI